MEKDGESERLRLFGDWLRIVLTDRRIAQKQLAKAMEVDENQVSRWLRGYSGISRKNAEKLATILTLDKRDVLSRAGYVDMSHDLEVDPSIQLFAERVKAVLKYRGMTQYDCALLTGFSHSATRGHLSGGKDPGIPGLLRYAQALKTTVAYLTGMDNDAPMTTDIDEKLMGRIVSLADPVGGNDASACRFQTPSADEWDALADRIAIRIGRRLVEDGVVLTH